MLTEIIKHLNIVDIAIVLILLSYGIVGGKRGFFKQGVMTLGIVIVFILSFYLKNPVASFLSTYLPFFKFGIFKELISLNIILYQGLAFLIVYGLLVLVLAILIKVSGIIEKILKATVILSIPSKIGGFVIGLIEGYVMIFVILFVVNQPFIKFNEKNDSYLMPKILNSSPVLSNIVKKTNDTVIEVKDIIKDYNTSKNSRKFNNKIINVMLDNKIITKEYITNLQKKGKL